jgi:hypothetical protein
MAVVINPKLFVSPNFRNIWMYSTAERLIAVSLLNLLSVKKSENRQTRGIQSLAQTKLLNIKMKKFSLRFWKCYKKAYS